MKECGTFRTYGAGSIPATHGSWICKRDKGKDDNHKLKEYTIIQCVDIKKVNVVFN